VSARIHLTGELSVEADGLVVRAADMPGRQGRLAFARLVLSPHPVSRDELGELLWPGQLPKSWERDLSAVVSKLRSLLGPVGLGEALTSAVGCYQLRLSETVRVDTEEARSNLDAAETALLEDDDAALPAASVAVSLLRRPFLPGETGTWVEARRAESRQLLLRALDTLITALDRRGEHAEAIAYATEQIEIEPFRESSYITLMRLQTATGNRAEALRTYERGRALFAEELGVPPSGAMEAAYLETLHADLQPGARSTASVRGTVTFLFTDIEGSTALWERHPEAMKSALVVHDEILRATIERHDGAVFATGGDGLSAAFARGDAAVAAAIEVQERLASTTWPQDLALKVRMGLHTGESDERSDDYFGPAVNRTARVMEAANGSQILISSATRDVVGHGLGASTIAIDLGQHELRDVVEPMRLYRLEAPSFASDPRPPRTGAARAGNLPLPVGALLGREADIEAVLTDLATSRVVTLVGVGGVGKTRLAIEVGRQLQPHHSDGVWFAALDTVDQPDALLRALHSLFGVESPGQRDLGSLLDGLRRRRALLVLDNCEHLLDAAAEVAEAIVTVCPHMQVLATSREPLDVDGERTRRVRSLATDDGGPATALFQLRAEEAGAQLDHDRDAEAIARICRRLDGIPLAIELAAARARSLPPADIAARLDDMFGLLTGGRRGRAERHRTLRATLEWSYELLSEDEKALLARLSIFAGSFSLAAAEAIAQRDGSPSSGVVDLLDRLVARSLVMTADEGDEARFRVLEPVRHLAAEKLSVSGETEAMRAAHTQWYLELIVDLSARWRAGDDQGTWPVAARELANLHVAFDHLIESSRIDDAQRFAAAAYDPIGMHFDNAPTYDWAPRALDLDPDHVGQFTASVCAMVAWGASNQGDLDGAARALARGVQAIEQGSNDEGQVASAALGHAVLCGQLVVSDEFLQRSLDDALESDDPYRQIWVLFSVDRADEATTIARRLGNQTMLALAQSFDGLRGSWQAAETFWESAQRSHSFYHRNNAAHRLGHLLIRDGSAVEGLLHLRAPARDWLLRNDARVWAVLHSIAAGLAATGEAEVATRLHDAIGERHLALISTRQRERLTALLDAAIEDADRERPVADAERLDAGAAVELALNAVDRVANR
jgi:predicted ATPase/class 3 adenylate cyclase